LRIAFSAVPTLQPWAMLLADKAPDEEERVPLSGRRLRTRSHA
jgi:hypothetical protein